MSVLNAEVDGRCRGKDYEDYDVRKGYRALSGSHDAVHWRKFVGNADLRPRYSFFLWLMCHDRLRTKDKLSHWGAIYDDVCVLCSKEVETREHVFVQCEFTKEIM